MLDGRRIKNSSYLMHSTRNANAKYICRAGDKCFLSPPFATSMDRYFVIFASSSIRHRHCANDDSDVERGTSDRAKLTAPTHVETRGDTCIDLMKLASESICLHTLVFRAMTTLKYVFQNVESSFSSNIIVNINKRYVFPIRR